MDPLIQFYESSCLAVGAESAAPRRQTSVLPEKSYRIHKFKVLRLAVALVGTVLFIRKLRSRSAGELAGHRMLVANNLSLSRLGQ